MTLSSVAKSRQKGRSIVSKCFMWLIWTLGNQDEPMVALVLQSAPKKDFEIAKVGKSTAGGQMPRLSKEFERVTLSRKAYGSNSFLQSYIKILSNSFDNRGIWPPAALSLTFAVSKSFFGALCNNSAIIGSS